MSSLTVASVIFALLVCIVTAVPTTPVGLKCGENEYFDKCTGCEYSCSDAGLKPCPLICKRPGACRCKLGFARDSVGRCIPRETCPAVECPAGEVWEQCGGCESFCFDPKNPSCATECTFGRCVCPKGFLRNDKHECIAAEQCSA